jgi:hypothetical protein
VEREPDSSGRHGSLTDNVVGLLDGKLAVEALADDHGPLQVSTAIKGCMIVPSGGILRQVGANQDVDRVMEFHQPRRRRATRRAVRRATRRWQTSGLLSLFGR